jgi:hypothetical protein
MQKMTVLVAGNAKGTSKNAKKQTTKKENLQEHLNVVLSGFAKAN